MGKEKKEPEPSEEPEPELLEEAEAEGARAKGEELAAEHRAEIEAEEAAEASRAEAEAELLAEELRLEEDAERKAEEAETQARVEAAKEAIAAEEAAATEDKWTSVSGKVLTSEKDAFKGKAKSEDMVPSKLIRAFVQSFINPAETEEAAAPETDIACEVCGKEITDDYYRFEDTYKCGACVTALVQEKQAQAVEEYMRMQALEATTGAKEPLPSKPAAEAPAAQPAEPPQPAEELVRVACTKCLAEAFIPKGKATWACQICNFVNTVGAQ